MMALSKPFALPYFRRRDGRSIRRHAGSQYQYSPLAVCKAYQIPAFGAGVNSTMSWNGAGVTVGIGELGGSLSQTDLTAYLRSIGLPDNQVTIVNPQNQQPDPGGADVEVMLDACIVAAIANGAKIRVYFAQNTSADFTAVTKQMASECDVVSWSWGAPEDAWAQSDMDAMTAVIQAATVQGVNVFVAAGDNGASDGESGTHVDFPSSCPFAIGCGGTNLQANGATILAETVWNDGASAGATGGGYSTVYGEPSYQSAAHITNPTMKRGVPDVAGVADPETGWIIRANGSNQVVGGTSAVAPMWAAICALMQQANGGNRLGFMNTILYSNPQALRDVTSGSNQGFDAGPGWDADTGWGTPNGPALFALVQGLVPMPPTPPPSPPPAPPPSPPPFRCPWMRRAERRVKNMQPGDGMQFLWELARELMESVQQG